MPYISQDRREEIAATGEIPATSGELNYLLTLLILSYFQENGGRYQQINDVLGALEGAKLEFYRRVASPYENVKIEENGDVYDAQ